MEKYKFASISIIDDNISGKFCELDSWDLNLTSTFTEEEFIGASVNCFSQPLEDDNENLEDVSDLIVGKFRNREYTKVIIDGKLCITMHITY